jgi:hypothetical protein
MQLLDTSQMYFMQLFESLKLKFCNFLQIAAWQTEEVELPAPPHLLSADGKQELYFRTSKKETMLDVLSGSSPCGWWP